MRDENPDTAEHSLDELYRRPGFLLRRAHQITVALFLEETVALGLTTTQYGVMVVLRARGGLDQAGIARSIGIDRSTSGLVVGKLDALGFVECRIDSTDKRRKVITLSKAGRAVLDKVEQPARRAVERALQVFSAKDAARFLELLGQFVSAFNAETRAPIDIESIKTFYIIGKCSRDFGLDYRPKYLKE